MNGAVLFSFSSYLAQFQHGIHFPGISRFTVPQHLRTPILASLLVGVYLSTVQILRFRRVKKIAKKYGKFPKSSSDKCNDDVAVKKSDVKLTPAEAWEIIHMGIVYDLPGLMYYTLTFALFKTYGIVSKSILEYK